MSQQAAELDPRNPAEQREEGEHDEVALVLEGLKDLLKRTTSPYVQVCLQEAYTDIVHLSRSA
jgi:hypothetical protein